MGGLGDSRKEEDLHVGGWDYLVVRVGGGVPVYLICNMHLCMHSYSCLHVGFRVISYLESSSQQQGYLLSKRKPLAMCLQPLVHTRKH